MAGTTNFPAFLQLNYDENGVNARFESDIRSMTKSAEQKFKASFDEVTKSINQSLQPSNFTGLGKLDLGTSNFRQAAAEAKLYKESVAATLRTASALAAETGDTTRETKAYIQALAAQNIEADQAVKSANAQVASYTRLQTALDITSAKSSKLAAAQRQIYAEQAAAAREQVNQQNNRNAFTQMVAPGLTGSAVNRGATTSALEQREALDQLRRAEVGAAEGARLLEAITRSTGLAFEKTSLSARESARAFIEADKAQEKLTAETNAQKAAMDELRKAELGAAEGARLLEAITKNTGLAFEKTAISARESAQAFIEADLAQQKLTSEANELRAALDPMFMAQQKFDQEMVRAERLYHQGAISAREYAQAQALARTNIKGASDEIQRQGTAMANQARQGTTASGAVINSLGSQRFAMIQVGQQLQDMTVGFASGQRTATIFAQQLPQLGFALTGFNGKVGALGRLLAGPWGVGIFAAITVAAFGLTKAFEKAAEGTDDLAGKSLTLTDALSKERYGTEEATKALREFNAEKALARKSDALAIDDALRSAAARIEDALAIREQIQAILDKTRASRGELEGSPLAGFGGQLIGPEAILQTNLDENLAKIESLQKVLNNVRIDDANDKAKAAVDPLKAINDQYDRMAAAATRAAAGNYELTNSLQKNLTQIERNRKAALDAARDSTRSSPKTTPVTLSEVTRILERELGAVIGSTTRTKTQNAAAGGSKNSYHLFGQGIDLPFSKGNNRKITKDQIRSALAEEGIAIEELLSSGDRGHNDHTHIAFSRRRRSPESLANSANREAEQAAAAAAKETSRLASLSDQAAESILRINEQYDEQPRLVDRAAQSTRKLDSIITELSDPKNSAAPRVKELIEEAKAARTLAANAVNTEIGKYVEENEAHLRILELQAAGLEEQADILIEINRLDERLGLTKALEDLQDQHAIAQQVLEDEQSSSEARATALAVIEKTAGEMSKIADQQQRIRDEAGYIVTQEERLNEIISRRRQETGYYLDALNSVRGTLTSILSGQKTDILGNLKKTMAELRGSLLFDQIFGDAFAQIEAQLRKNTPLGKANDRLVKEIDQTGRVAHQASNAFAEVANAAIGAAAALQGVAQPSTQPLSAANDNNGGIVVTAIRDEIAIETRSVSDLADAMANGIVGPLASSLNEVFGTRFSQQLSGALSSALSGYLQGGEVGGVLGGLQGITKILGDEGIISGGLADKLGKGLGGAVGGAGTGTQIAGIAKALGIGGNFSTTGSQIGGAIGSVVPIPGGEIIGSVIGGLLGGLFKKKPKGVSVISGVDGPAAISGNKSKVRDNLSELSGGIQESLASIAEQFGAEVGAFRVSIGQRKDYFRVSASGSREVDAKKYPRNAGSDLLYDGKDAEEAARIALLNAIQDGAIVGIRQGSQRLLRAGTDIEKAVREALDFEGVFKRLRQYKDPVGAALDELDKEFKRLIGIFGKAGASAQEYADLEELYGIERAQAVKEAGERITGSLKDLFEELTIGDSGLSLRSRLGSAQSAYDPLAQRVADGDVTAYDDYADAARNLLELQREVYGSSEDYFKLLEEVTNLTKTRIDEESNIASIAVDRDTPFTVDQTPVVNALNYQTDLLASYLAAIAKNGMSGAGIPSYGGGGGGSGFNPYVVNF